MKVCLIGGARSGKSSLAQQLVTDFVTEVQKTALEEPPVLVVTFGKTGCDEEFDARIAHHRKNRPESWEVLELGDEPIEQWGRLIAERAQDRFRMVLVDCVATMLSCIIDDVLLAHYGASWTQRETFENNLAGIIALETKKSIAALAQVAPHAVFVTNEVGLSVVASSAAGRLFVDSLGWVNQDLCDLCEKTYLVVAGSALELGKPSMRMEWNQ